MKKIIFLAVALITTATTYAQLTEEVVVESVVRPGLAIEEEHDYPCFVVNDGTNVLIKELTESGVKTIATFPQDAEFFPINYSGSFISHNDCNPIIALSTKVLGIDADYGYVFYYFKSNYDEATQTYTYVHRLVNERGDVLYEKYNGSYQYLSELNCFASQTYDDNSNTWHFIPVSELKTNTSDVAAVKTTKKNSGKVYNLGGVEVNKESASGIIIENGKKILK